ncbi:MAG: cyclase family protein [Patescibacteria group bacterium]
MIIDLSVAINLQTPVYPGDPATKIEPAGVLSRDGYCDHYISPGTHVGTHIDAPMHMIEGGISLDQIPADNFIGQGRYIGVTNGNLMAIQDAHIEHGDIVLLDTGMNEKYHDPVYFSDYPAMSEETAHYLVKKKVKMVGLDACSVDNIEGFPIHKILLAGNVLIIENLTNLRTLAGKQFKVYALPLNLELDASPARVIAETT